MHLNSQIDFTNKLIKTFNFEFNFLHAKKTQFTNKDRISNWLVLRLLLWVIEDVFKLFYPRISHKLGLLCRLVTIKPMISFFTAI